MPNPNYLKGRRFEYEVVKEWNTGPFKATRSAGSHSEFDVFAYRTDILDGFTELHYGSSPQVHREVRGGYEYTRYVTPIIGYGIQAKVRKVRGKRGKVQAGNTRQMASKKSRAI